MKKLLSNKVLFLLCIISFLTMTWYLCKEDKKNSIKEIKWGVYANGEDTERIIIMDSSLYIHQYKIKNMWCSDTNKYVYAPEHDPKSKYYYSYTSGENFRHIIFENFFVSDSSLYYMNIMMNKGNKEIAMLYFPNYNTQIIGGKPKPVMASDIDSYGADILYYKDE